MFAVSSGLSYPFPINQYNGATNYDRVGVSADRSNITIYSEGSWGNNWKAYVTLEYTKTNDQESDNMKKAWDDLKIVI